MSKPLRVSYDKLRDILTINGVKYSGDIFRTLSVFGTHGWYKYIRTVEDPEIVTVIKSYE